MLKNLLLVGLGGFAGSILRYSVTLLGTALSWSSWIGTFAVNSIGSLLIGIIMASCGKGSLSLLLAVGLCGGFTTFSTFSAQSLEMIQAGRYGMGAAYITGTIIICILCTWAGMTIGKQIVG